MDIQTLANEKAAFAKVDGTNSMKVFASDFVKRYNLEHVKGVKIYALLRDEEGYVSAWRKMKTYNEYIERIAN